MGVKTSADARLLAETARANPKNVQDMLNVFLRLIEEAAEKGLFKIEDPHRSVKAYTKETLDIVIQRLRQQGFKVIEQPNAGSRGRSRDIVVEW